MANRINSGIITFFLLILFSCVEEEKTKFLVDLETRKYVLSIDLEANQLEYDSTKIYLGDPVLTSFKVVDHPETFDIYVGSENPGDFWKGTFDFQEKLYSIKEQVGFDELYTYLGERTFDCCHSKGRLVQFKRIMWNRIEGQVLCNDSLIVNLVMTANLDSDTKNLLEKFIEISESIEIHKLITPYHQRRNVD